ncbi:vWA domain-containing protein [Roseibium sediminis]|uniref:vWA domain-containing protein n=1 Tax=Roseibium sediminis TaxID=1775174 RepID=UPI00123CC97A|nr:VWA domain-containing protein [Roseibium sediminis]
MIHKSKNWFVAGFLSLLVLVGLVWSYVGDRLGTSHMFGQPKETADASQDASEKAENRNPTILTQTGQPQSPTKPSDTTTAQTPAHPPVEPEAASESMQMADQAVQENPVIRMYSGGEPGGLSAPAAPLGKTRMLLQPSGASVSVSPQLPNTERFPEAESNPLKQVKADPVSTFSVDVDTASYAFIRSELVNGRKPNPEAVRIEEMINYFQYDYATPDSREAPFSTNVSVVETPWNADTKLLHIGLKGYTVPLADLPPQNLVFLIDTSGSMQDETKLPLLQQAFRLLLSTLRSDDTVAIVTYAGNAGVLLEPTALADKSKIAEAINSLTSGGSTAGHAGLKEAYKLAETMQGDDAKTRIILATDGDFNVGLSSADEMKQFVKEKRESGITLSVLGFGRGNYNDELMQALAQNGNGVAAYIDTLSEARKVLVDQIVSSISTIAQDVKIQVEFNPATVAEYRLVGYETRALKTEDFNNDKVDAGDIGAGHTVTALYEVTPVGSPAVRIDDLRYAAPSPSEGDEAPAEFSDELAFVKLRYKLPGEAKSTLISTPVTLSTSAIPQGETEFAAAVAGFGQLLKGTDYLGAWTAADALKLAEANVGDDPFNYRNEFLSLLRLSSIAQTSRGTRF